MLTTKSQTTRKRVKKTPKRSTVSPRSSKLEVTMEEKGPTISLNFQKGTRKMTVFSCPLTTEPQVQRFNLIRDRFLENVGALATLRNDIMTEQELLKHVLHGDASKLPSPEPAKPKPKLKKRKLPLKASEPPAKKAHTVHTFEL